MKFDLPTGWFMTTHIGSKQFLAQLIELLFKIVSKIFEKSAGRNINPVW
jgi:hypothetical protein